MELTDRHLQCFGAGRVFKDSQDRVNSIDFHRSADLLVAASHDSIRLFDVNSGTLRTTLHCRKYGCANVAYTHHESAILHSSVVGDNHAIRLLSLHDNNYQRYFDGHTAKVTSLSFSAKNDLFMSCSQDRTMRVWDLRSSATQGVLTVPHSAPAGVFDHQGLVFAVALDSGIIKLYDLSSFDKGPFETFKLPGLENVPTAVTCLQFSLDGKLLLAVHENRVFVLDAYSGEVTATFDNGMPDPSTPLEASFTPDAKYVMSGHEDRSIRVWSVATREEVARWSLHAGTPTCVKSSPTSMLVASAAHTVCLWVPDQAKLNQAMHSATGGGDPAPQPQSVPAGV